VVARTCEGASGAVQDLVGRKASLYKPSESPPSRIRLATAGRRFAELGLLIQLPNSKGPSQGARIKSRTGYGDGKIRRDTLCHLLRSLQDTPNPGWGGVESGRACGRAWPCGRLAIDWRRLAIHDWRFASSLSGRGLEVVVWSSFAARYCTSTSSARDSSRAKACQSNVTACLKRSNKIGGDHSVPVPLRYG